MPSATWSDMTQHILGSVEDRIRLVRVEVRRMPTGDGRGPNTPYAPEEE